MVKMARSKHDERMRHLVLEAGLWGYYKLVEREIIGVLKVNRPLYDGKRERKTRKIFGSKVWYQPNNL